MTSSQTIVLITGANRGLGYETALNLLQHSAAYHVLLGSRSLSHGLSAISTLLSSPSILGTASALEIDVTSPASVYAAAQLAAEQYGRLDILVNNAGIYPTEKVPRDALNAAMQVNVIGALSVTEAFLPLLKRAKEPRLVFVSSSMGSVSQAADPTSKYHHPLASEYRASKAALNMLMVQYWVRYGKEDGDGNGVFIKVHAADPGLCVTDFFDRESVAERGGVEASVGAERIAVVVRGERDEWVGKVVGEYGVSPW